MFAVPEWDVPNPPQAPLSRAKDKAVKVSKKVTKKMLNRVHKQLDAAVNTPTLTTNLLQHGAANDATPTKASSTKKKRNRKKNKQLKESKKLQEEKSSSPSSDGSILRQGIRFENVDDFARFKQDSEQSKRKGKRKKPSRDEDSSEEVSTGKKAKLMQPFSLEKLKSILAKKLAAEDEHASATPVKKATLTPAQEKLKSSRFRFLNEKLYTQTGESSQKMFRRDCEAFKAYHEGYQRQIEQWPDDPLQLIITALLKREESTIIADFGCGEARLAQALPSHTVHSFDFHALNPLVTPCDMAKTPLANESVDIVVFCLSLMGTNIKDYIKEANRVMKTNGILKIAEVASRFQHTSVDAFIKDVSKFGFSLKWKNDHPNNYFVYIDMKKVSKTKKKGLPDMALKPCLYKKR